MLSYIPTYNAIVGTYLQCYRIYLPTLLSYITTYNAIVCTHLPTMQSNVPTYNAIIYSFQQCYRICLPSMQSHVPSFNKLFWIRKIEQHQSIILFSTQRTILLFIALYLIMFIANCQRTTVQNPFLNRPKWRSTVPG